MATKAPTVRSLAASLGLSRSTVAEALKGSPHFSPATVQRVQAAAAAVGYRRNPLAGAVMSEIRRSHLQKFRGVLAAVDLDETERPPLASQYHRIMVEGARERAMELGFKLQTYSVGKKGITVHRLDSILQARGIQGVFLLPSWWSPDLSKLDWSRYAGVYTDYFIDRPALHTVCPDHFRGMIDVLKQIKILGYRRAGLIVSRHHETRLQFHWSGAFLGYQAGHPEIGKVPPLGMDEPERAPFIRWFKRYNPDVVIGHPVKLIDWMKEAGAKVPETHGFVCLNRVFQDRPCAGLDLQPRVLAARGIESLIAQIQRGEMGIPAHPSITGIPAEWVAGPTVRAVR